MASVRKSSIRLIFLGGFYVLFLVVGAAVFSAIEGPVEVQRLRELRATRNRLLFDRRQCLVEEDLDEFINNVIEAHKAGISLAQNTSVSPKWSFGQSLFFAASVLTTIGYGHVSPLSDGGKIFCVLYAIVGIPLTLILFTALVERLMLVTSLLLSALMSSLGHLYHIFYLRLVHVSIIFCFVLVFVFLVPSAVFTIIETNWNFLDSFYYCFISMTTIGLGDYIPGEDANQMYRPLYKICTTLYLFIGLVLMLLLVANIYDIPELNLGHYFYLRSDELDGEQKLLKSSAAAAGAEQSRYTSTSATSVNKAYMSNSRSDDVRQLTED
jgi:potassium channel subfamily K protein 1